MKELCLYLSFCISRCMKTRLMFWTIYFFAILIIYLCNYPRDNTPVQKVDIGIKSSTIYLLKQLEGVRHTAYDDGYGNMTIGVGHYIKPDESKLYYATLSQKQVNDLLKRDMEPCERVLKNKLDHPINQSQFDALMSFCHNVGPDRFAGSDVFKYVNLGETKKAADALLTWNKPREIVKRRQKERKLFLQGA